MLTLVLQACFVNHSYFDIADAEGAALLKGQAACTPLHGVSPGINWLLAVHHVHVYEDNVHAGNLELNDEGYILGV